MADKTIAKARIHDIGAEIVRKTFEQGGNCCEAVLAATGREWGFQASADLQASARLFGKGMHSGCTCGALVGMVLASGIRAARTPHPLGNKLANRLHQRFKEEFGSTCCRVILKNRPALQRFGKEGCIRLTTRATEILIQEWEGVRDVAENLGDNSHSE